MRALRNILDMEAANGFADRAVAGGLDRFLETLRAQAGADPVLRALDERGLLSVAYAELDRGRGASDGRTRFAASSATGQPPAPTGAPLHRPSLHPSPRLRPATRSTSP